ncbi:MAG TPA: metallophosphoesterase [Tepidisphaeraceae bacterium]|nr:metallophosphoesterase [Tepidisphaeraceae bacterium]
MAVDADQVMETFGAATDENRLDPLRDQQVIVLPAEGELWIAGDIHDHRNNFRKITVAADLGNNPQRHLILQELIHGDHYDEKGREDSWQTLHKAAELKCDFPEQVHFLFANHDLAQIHGEGIMKAGTSVCEAFTAAVKRDFQGRAAAMNVAITEFLLSIPLAARTQTGIFFSHSMPTDDQMDDFDYTVFDRPLSGDDYLRRKGPIYKLIWGRHITPAGVDKFLAHVNARMIVTGHQPQESGYLANGDKHLIIASDHNQGVFLPIDLAKEYTMDDLVEVLTKFVAVELPET